MHRQGYNGTSVRDIVRAAGVPQGSFTNHFASKEVFALEALDLYYARSCKMMRETLGNEALSPLGRIRAYIEAYRSFFRQHGCQHGCLCGNFAAEASDQSEPLRKDKQKGSVLYNTSYTARSGQLWGSTVGQILTYDISRSEPLFGGKPTMFYVRLMPKISV